MRCRASLSATVVVLWLGLAHAPVAAADATPTIRVHDAWIRWLPANLPAAGYMTLTNIGDKPEILIGTSSPDFGEVSLHVNRLEGGSITMMPATRITIDPHSSLSFAAAGYHVMLMQPNKPLKPGDHVLITLQFAGGSSLTVPFDVRKPDSSRVDSRHER
jgi:copper(I)-binding protein